MLICRNAEGVQYMVRESLRTPGLIDSIAKLFTLSCEIVARMFQFILKNVFHPIQLLRALLSKSSK